MTSAERLALYNRRMKKAGFRRISVWVSGDLAEKLTKDRGPGECGGRALERLLLGKSAKQRTSRMGRPRTRDRRPKRYAYA